MSETKLRAFTARRGRSIFEIQVGYDLRYCFCAAGILLIKELIADQFGAQRFFAVSGTGSGATAASKEVVAIPTKTGVTVRRPV